MNSAKFMQVNTVSQQEFFFTSCDIVSSFSVDLGVMSFQLLLQPAANLAYQRISQDMKR